MTTRRLAILLGLAISFGSSPAATLHVAQAGDATSMDPHSLNETMQLGFLGNIYEPLVARDKTLALTPGLATTWRRISPTVWRFSLRKGVTFHDGSPFGSDDVVFSFKRAMGDGSDMKPFTSGIKEVRKVDDLMVEIETLEPYPILPDVLSEVYMMSHKWCEANKAERPVDKRKGVENAASFKTDGTGPYRLKERQPGSRTVLVRNAQWWGKAEGNVDEVVFTPIASDPTRVAALLSGEVDVIEPVPLQDIDKIKADPALKVMQGPELRTIFIGMDQKRDELKGSNVKGRNPFKDRRVRLALYEAIDIEAIRTKIMRGAATPTALPLAPGVNGFAADLNKRAPYDVEGAKKLLAEAGYPTGFEVPMNCPNDRYVNDEQICQALAANWARIGVKIDLQLESTSIYFPKVLRRDTSLYLLGWTPATYDAHNVLLSLLQTPSATTGTFNLGSYSNPKVDELIGRIQSEVDPDQRLRLIHEALKLQQDDVAMLPLHQQALAWGMKRGVTLVQPADDTMPYKWVNLK